MAGQKQKVRPQAEGSLSCGRPASLALGENADEAAAGERFVGVLCHGVLGYLQDPDPLVAQLCRCAEDGGIVSVMTGNAHATAVQPTLERRWADALAPFEVRTGTSVLGARPAQAMENGNHARAAARGRRTPATLDTSGPGNSAEAAPSAA